MSLVMRTQRRSRECVTGYEFVGGGAERAAQIATLTTTLFMITPSGVYNTMTEDGRNAAAALSLQLVALLDGWDGDRTFALAALSGIRSYLFDQRTQLATSEQIDEISAGNELITGFAYFEAVNWDALLSED